MNRNDFRSAYDKLTLPEDVKADMKKKLLEQMADDISADGYNSDTHQAREMKFEPGKRHTARTAAIAGTAAALVIAAGAGLWFNRDRLTPVSGISSTAEDAPTETSDSLKASSEPTRESSEAVDEQNYYTQTTALGVLKFQTFVSTTADHLQPQESVQTDSAEDLIERYPIYSYGTNHVEKYHNNEPPVPDMKISECYKSDTGAVFVLKNSDGTRQVNFSISTIDGEFMPITLPDGSYIVPEGERLSRFAMSWLNFITPDYFTMAAGSYMDGGDEYFAAEYSYFDGGEYRCRIDARNISRDEFIACIDYSSRAYLCYDYKGWVNTEGNEIDPYKARQPQTGAELPGVVTSETEYGSLTYNPVTVYGGTTPTPEWNIMCNSDLDTDVPAELSYTTADAAKFSGIDVLKGLTAENVLGTSGSTAVTYFAYYLGLIDEDTADANALPNKWYGANLTMNPGDDQEEYEQAQRYIVKDKYIDGNAGDYVEYGSHYLTDKLDYFDNYERMGACYKIRFYGDEGQRAQLSVSSSDWSLLDDMHLVFAQYPAVPSEFTQGADGFGELYVGRGYDAWGELHYIAGWELDGWENDSDAPRYVVLNMRGVDEETFAAALNEIYAGK